MGSAKQYYAERRAKGICVQCPNPSNGKAKCADCYKKDQECRQTRTAQRKLEGRCTACPEIAIPGYTLCRSCLEARNKTSLARYYTKKKKNICRDCPKPVPSGVARCPACNDLQRAYQKERYKKNKENGICIFCPEKAIVGKTYCTNCRKKALRFAQRRRTKMKNRILDHYGHECACCGLTIFEALQIDHVHGGGTKHLKEIGQSGLYRWLVKNNFPEGFQTLCVLCNTLKGTEDCCPHKLMPYAAQQLTRKYTEGLAKILKENS